MKLSSFVVLLLALVNSTPASTLKISAGSATRAAGEVEANYSTSHLFVDEVTGDAVPVTVFFDPQTLGVETAEVFTNLNRRERAQLDANGDGVEDGIQPPSASGIAAGSDAHYFKAHTMSGVPGGYQLTLLAQKTGAYRLTLRWRKTSDAPGSYRFYNDEIANGLNKRDHAIVVSPRSARDLQLYEVNPLTVTARGTLPGQRGTFADLASGVAGGPRFGLQYVKNLGANMLWFQPVHPNGIAGRQIDPATGQPFEVGSPYAVKNFFEIMPLMASGFTPGGNNDTPAGRAQALAEFQAFASAADAAGVGVMLDAPFNHTSYDAELAALGQTFFGGASATAEIRNTEARFFARSGSYDRRASSNANIAIAPDRIAEFAFSDTFEVFYGRYAALVSGSTGGHLNEGDWFDYSIGSENSAGDGNGHFDAITQNVWRYFAAYTLHWLTQTGYPANLTGAALDSDAGIDALRADFGQGLPPQCWEYIINKTRTRKWNFIFMAESLDGGPVTYRSGRHFDILNENIVFPLHAAQTTMQFRAIYEARRNAYGEALVLLNTSSHDEDHYQDPFHALLRHAVNATIDGVPLIFPGQELGLSGTVIPPNDTNNALTPFGYDRYEQNVGKPIPHFKKYNSLMPLWLKTQPGHATFDFGLAQLAPVFSAIGKARAESAALRSSNRFFLNLQDGTPHGQIFSVAKFEQRNAPPNVRDVVFGFVNLDRNASPATPNGNRFNLAIDTDADGVNDFGIKPARRYNVKNRAAYTAQFSGRRDTFLIPGGVLGSDLLAQGLFVALNAVPTSDAGWSSAPYEAQYLKLYDVTPPPPPASVTPPKAYALGTNISVSWTLVVEPEGGISGYRIEAVGVMLPTVQNFVVGPDVNTLTFNGGFESEGGQVTIIVRTINAAGVQSSTGQTVTVRRLTNAGDFDDDGQTNGAEDFAGTDPLSTASVFKVIAITRLSGNAVQLTWTSVADERYEVRATNDLAQPFMPISLEITATAATTSFTDLAAGDGAKFYEVRVLP